MDTVMPVELPVELLLECFQYFSLDDRVAARAVCRAWYTASDGCPVTISRTLSYQPFRLQRYLNQMRLAPLVFDCRWPLQDRLCELLAPHIHHTAVLDITTAYGMGDPGHLAALLERSAPRLRRIRLDLGMDGSFDTANWLGKCAPQLTHCYVTAFPGILHALRPFAAIRVLCLYGHISADDLELVQSGFPALEELSLACVELPSRRNVTNPPPSTRLRRLEVVTLSFTTFDLHAVLEFFAHETISMVAVSLSLASQSGPPFLHALQRIIAALASPDIAVLDVSHSYGHECTLRLTAQDGRRRIYGGISWERIPEILPMLHLRAVREFTIVGLPNPPLDCLRSFYDCLSGLRALTIVVHGADGLRTPLAHHPAVDSITLAISPSSYQRRGILTLSAGRIRAFLRDDAVAGPPPPLKRLCILGIAILDASALDDLAEIVSVEPHRPISGFVGPEDDIRGFDRRSLLTD